MKKIMHILFALVTIALMIACASRWPLYDAAGKGDLHSFQMIMESERQISAEEKIEALHHAAYKGHLEIVRYLIEQKGMDVDVRDSIGSPTLTAAASGNQVDVVKYLIDKGADVKAINDSGRSALNYAAINGAYSAAQYLIIKGADIDEALTTLDQIERESEGEHWATNARNGAAMIKQLAKKQKQSSMAQLPSSKPVFSIMSDVDEPPFKNVEMNNNSYAIVIGIEEYRQKLPKADYAVRDAEIVTGYLIKTLGYPEENIVTLTNDHAAKSDFEKYFEQWFSNNVEKGGTVFVFYSGHGAPNPRTGDAYLVPYDGDPSFIDQTGYSLKRMYEALGKLPAKEIIVVLDSCFSGAGGRSVLAKGAKPLVMTLNTPNIQKNITVMTASSGDQTSSAYEEKGHGLFTYFLLKSIKNEDVVKPNGSIEISDLYSYIKPQVERIARKQFNNEQTPQLIRPGGLNMEKNY